MGFQRSPSAHKYCRFCQIDKNDMKYASIEDPSIRRNRDNYNEDVLMCDARATGIREYSTLNSIPYFHVTESSAEDSTHTVEEGVLRYVISDSLHSLIYIDKIITLEQLNTRMKNFSYGEQEKSNKPNIIFKEQLENEKFRMTAAEKANFVQNLTFIIGDLIPEDNDVWKLILKTVSFFDFCNLPCFEKEDIAEWREVIKEMNDLYIEVLSQHLKPHHHFATHFPTDTEKFGPLKFARTIR